MANYSDTDNARNKGPISQHLSAKAYLESNHVPQMFQSLIAGLMLERPENHIGYLDGKLEQIKEKGLEHVDWESFVHHLHPSRQPIHMELIHDEKEGAPQVQVENEIKPFADMEPKEEYKPQVFQLTEPQDE